MSKESLRYFLIFFFLSLSIFFLSKFNFLELPQSILSKITTTITSPVLSAGYFLSNFSQNKAEKELRDENLALQKKLVDQQNLTSDNKALHDQFQTIYPRSLDLLPAKILQSSSFIPGAFSPDSFIIDKGSADGVRVGDAVIIKNNLIGEIAKTTDFLSEVMSVTNPNIRFAAKTTGNAAGVVRGEGNGDLILDNVLLSDHLTKGDLVVTSGDLKLDETGLPPDIIVGQILSVESNSADLFQRAKIKTSIDLSKISEVFVFKGLR